MSVCEEYLERRWLKLAESLSLSESVNTTVWQVIRHHYNEPHRYYHTLTHLYHIFTLYDEIVTWVEDHVCIGLAIFFHDVIYDPLSKTNEEDSVTLFNTVLADHLDESLREKVGRFILASKAHSWEESSENDLKIFLDLDMSILGSDQSEYQQYSAAIRKEYSVFSDEVYREGRAKVLRSFLSAGQPVFATLALRERWEMKARENIEQECQQLTSSC